MSTTEETRIDRVSSLLELGSGTVTLMIHGVEQGAIFDLLQDGLIDSVKREKRVASYGEDDRHYLAASVSFDGIDVTLFTGDLT